MDGGKNKYYKFTYELEILFAEEELFLERRKICRNAYSSDKLKIVCQDFFFFSFNLSKYKNILYSQYVILAGVAGPKVSSTLCPGKAY